MTESETDFDDAEEQDEDFDCDFTDDSPLDDGDLPGEDEDGSEDVPGESPGDVPSPAGSSPVGDGAYTVKQGDCVSSIASEHGHFWETIWNHSGNEQLEKTRHFPDALLPGDSVVIPEIRRKVDSGATGTRHRFRRNGVPALLRLVVCRDGVPRADTPYRLDVDGMSFQGETNSEGRIERQIPPNARKATIVVDPEGDADRYDLDLGHVDPSDSATGVQSRLRNLGYDIDEVDGVLGPETRSALLDFQSEQGLEQTGKPDEQTMKALSKLHES